MEFKKILKTWNQVFGSFAKSYKQTFPPIVACIIFCILWTIIYKMVNKGCTPVHCRVFALAGAYIFAIFFGTPVTTSVVNKAWEISGRTEERLRPTVLAELVGIIERCLYITAMVFNQHAFVGVWLALKAVGGWSQIKEKERPLFAAFLIGVGLSLAFASVGWIFAEKLLINMEFVLAVIVPTLLVTGASIFWLRLEIESKPENTELPRNRTEEVAV